MTIRIIQCDVREELPKLAADSFDCIVTSPPYYGLRDYGTATWEGGDPACSHEPTQEWIDHNFNAHSAFGNGASTQSAAGKKRWYNSDGSCRCGARRIDAQIGLEPTLDAYLETIVGVCRELRRVLKPSGICFINIGDSYCASPPGKTSGDPFKTSGLAGRATARIARESCQNRPARSFGDLKPKDLMLVPERLGIALQADGWYVRSHIIWAKPNPMPESITDRPTSAHETIWMLTRSAKYFWDAEAVKEDFDSDNNDYGKRKYSKQKYLQYNGISDDTSTLGMSPQASGRNIRNVWTIPSHPFPGAHFATFPPALVERCIKAGSPRGGNILDPFAGSGTVGLVADRLGRDCTLIDLNTSYIDMAVNRIRDDAPLFVEVAAE